MLLRVLDAAGRHGPALLFAGVLAGLAMPALADAASPLRDAGVFCFTLGAFLRVAPSELRRTVPTRAGALALIAWTVVGVPLATWLGLAALGLDRALADALLLCALAPPLGGAATVAALLGLNAPLALWATVAGTLAAPWTMPALGGWLGVAGPAFEPLGTALRLALLVGGAAALAALAHRVSGPRLRANATAVTGFSVLGMVVFAIGAMHGVQAQALAQPSTAALAVLAAFAFNAGLQALGTVMFLRLGRRDAMTAGLVGGNRSVGLAWVGAGDGLPAAVELGLAAALLPIYVLPAMLRRGVARLLSTEPRAMHCGVPIRTL
jgi:predicted Na+-dependent transporter